MHINELIELSMYEREENRLLKEFPKYANLDEKIINKIHLRLLIRYETIWNSNYIERKERLSKNITNDHNSETNEYMNEFMNMTFGTKLCTIDRMERCVKTYFKDIL